VGVLAGRRNKALLAKWRTAYLENQLLNLLGVLTQPAGASFHGTLLRTSHQTPMRGIAPERVAKRALKWVMKLTWLRHGPSWQLTVNGAQAKSVRLDFGESVDLQHSTAAWAQFAGQHPSAHNLSYSESREAVSSNWKAHDSRGTGFQGNCHVDVARPEQPSSKASRPTSEAQLENQVCCLGSKCRNSYSPAANAAKTRKPHGSAGATGKTIVAAYRRVDGEWDSPEPFANHLGEQKRPARP